MNRLQVLRMAVRAAELFIDIVETIAQWLADRQTESLAEDG